MSVFGKQGVYRIDYYVNGHHEPVALNKRLKKGKTAAWGCFWVT
jgi:hypothetical protein